MERGRKSSGLPRKFTCGDSPPEEDLPSGDLLVVFERNVPTHHVVQQDAQGPDGGGAAVVAVVFDPLWWAVHSRACQVGGGE